MTKYVLASLAVFVGFAPVAWALDIPVRTVDRALLDELYYGPPEQAVRYVAGYTVRIDLEHIPRRDARRVDIDRRAVLYFDQSGLLLGWSRKSRSVVVGLWAIVASTAPDGRHLFNHVCIFFGRGRGVGYCATPLAADSSWIQESTRGNVFNLQPGAPVPFRYPRDASLAEIAGRFE